MASRGAPAVYASNARCQSPSRTKSSAPGRLARGRAPPGAAARRPVEEALLALAPVAPAAEADLEPRREVLRLRGVLVVRELPDEASERRDRARFLVRSRERASGEGRVLGGARPAERRGP